MIIKSRTILAMLFTLLCALALSVFSLSLPLPLSTPGSAFFLHTTLFLSTFIPALHICASILFFRGIKGFKQELYQPYRLIAIGIIVLGFVMMQSPLVTFFNLWEAPVMHYGYITLPYIAAVLIMYMGLRKLQRIVGAKTLLSSPLVGSASIVVGLLVIILLPHVQTSNSEFAFDSRNGFFAFTSFFDGMAAVVAFAISRKVAPAYKRMLTWLMIGLLTQAGLIFSSIFVTFAGMDERNLAGLQDLLTLTPIPFIIAGYHFYGLTADTREQEADQNASVIDIVLYTAQLSSNSMAIDPILDDLRLITARMKPGDALTDVDKAALGETYLKLEQYLTNSEVLRSFTQAELRSTIYARFYRVDTADSAFWSKLPPITAPAVQQLQPAHQY